MSTAAAPADLNAAARLYNLVLDTVLQSAACHPDWTVETHLAYLEGEEFIDLDAIASWHRPLTGWRHATVRWIVTALVNA